jgi:hypothetical protein
MEAPRALVIDLVEWVAEKPRTYDEVMLHWRTSCPRLPVWEDAIDAGLVQRQTKDGRAAVAATKKGLALLLKQAR